MNSFLHHVSESFLVVALTLVFAGCWQQEERFHNRPGNAQDSSLAEEKAELALRQHAKDAWHHAMSLCQKYRLEPVPQSRLSTTEQLEEEENDLHSIRLGPEWQVTTGTYLPDVIELCDWLAVFSNAIEMDLGKDISKTSRIRLLANQYILANLMERLIWKRGTNRFTFLWVWKNGRRQSVVSLELSWSTSDMTHLATNPANLQTIKGCESTSGSGIAAFVAATQLVSFRQTYPLFLVPLHDDPEGEVQLAEPFFLQLYQRADLIEGRSRDTNADWYRLYEKHAITKSGVQKINEAWSAGRLLPPG